MRRCIINELLHVGLHTDYIFYKDPHTLTHSGDLKLQTLCQHAMNFTCGRPCSGGKHRGDCGLRAAFASAFCTLQWAHWCVTHHSSEEICFEIVLCSRCSVNANGNWSVDRSSQSDLPNTVKLFKYWIHKIEKHCTCISLAFWLLTVSKGAG